MSPHLRSLFIPPKQQLSRKKCTLNPISNQSSLHGLCTRSTCIGNKITKTKTKRKKNERTYWTKQFPPSVEKEFPIKSELFIALEGKTARPLIASSTRRKVSCGSGSIGKTPKAPTTRTHWERLIARNSRPVQHRFQPANEYGSRLRDLGLRYPPPSEGSFYFCTTTWEQSAPNGIRFGWNQGEGGCGCSDESKWGCGVSGLVRQHVSH